MLTLPQRGIPGEPTSQHRVDVRNAGRSCRDRRLGSVTRMSEASGLDEPKETQ